MRSDIELCVSWQVRDMGPGNKNSRGGLAGSKSGGSGPEQGSCNKYNLCWLISGGSVSE